MPICPLIDLTIMAAGKRLFGLDLGDKTIGVAVSDPSQRIAMSVETIRRGKFAADLSALQKLMNNRDIGGIVIGLPISLDGTEGPRCQSVRAFARNLEKAGLALPVVFQDERMSTAAVERSLIGDLGMRRDKRAAVIDAHAAAYILQGALDALANLSRG